MGFPPSRQRIPRSGTSEPEPSESPSTVLGSGVTRRVRMLGLALTLRLVCASSSTSVEAAEAMQTRTSSPAIETIVEKFRTKAAHKQPQAWVLMRTGEIFQGEIKSMREGRITFDSDELGDIDFSMKHAYAVWPTEKMVFVFETETVEGTGFIQDNNVVVETDGRTVKHSKESLMSILPVAETELDRWSFAVDAGFDLSVGNSDQQTLSTHAKATRTGARIAFDFDYLGSLARTNGEATLNRHQIDSNLDYFVYRAFFVNLARVQVLRDTFKNIAVQATPTAGLGYRVFDERPFKWKFYGGGGYQFTQNESVEPGADKTEHNAGMALGTDFAWYIVRHLDLKLEFKTFLALTDFDRSTFNTRAIFRFKITKLVDFKFTTVHTRVQNPPVASDGTQPKSDDVQFIVGLGLSFD
jgi:putative salt-induced outer membrane protein YdiY